MRSRALVVAVVSFGVTAFAPAPFPRPDKREDVKKLAGTWTVTRYERGGTAVQRGSTLKVRIEGNAWSFLNVNAAGTTPGITYTVLLDQKKEPRYIDLTMAADASGVRVPVIKKLLGIYRFDRGDTNKVQVVFHTFGVKERPAGFDGADDRAYLMILQRDKP